MNPAAPVTSSFIWFLSVLLCLALGEVTGQPIVPGGQPDRVFALALHDRVRRPLGGLAVHLAGDREHLAVDLPLLEDLARELIPGAAPGGGHVVDAVLDPVDQPGQPVGEVPGVGGRGDLVADHRDLAHPFAQPQHRGDEVLAVDAEEAGGADDEVPLVGGRRRLLPGQLGARVGGERRGLVGLHIRRALLAVEDVVGGHVEHRGPDLTRGGGGVARPGAVDREGLVLGLLGTVDVGPGGAVDDQVGPLAVDLPAHRVGIADVHPGPIEADHVMPGVGRGNDEVAAQHPAGTGDQDLHRLFPALRVVTSRNRLTRWKVRCDAGAPLDAIRAIGNYGGMVKLDEKAHVPKVDAAAREQLANAFNREGVVAAMLIGSQARGNPGPLSDIDIAYWHEPELDRDARWRLRLDLIGAAEETMRTPEVDIVPLNEAPAALRQRAIRDAVRLVERDHDERVRLETWAILDYLDTQPLRDALRQRLKRLFKEDRFGRP